MFYLLADAFPGLAGLVEAGKSLLIIIVILLVLVSLLSWAIKKYTGRSGSDDDQAEEMQQQDPETDKKIKK